MILSGKSAVDVVVGSHDGPRVALLDCNLEIPQVDFAQGTYRNPCVKVKSVEFLVVSRKMLDGRPDSLALDSTDVAGGYLASQQRVFGIIFKVPSAQRIALDVDAWGKKNVHPIFKNLVADGFTDFLDKRRIPGGGE